MKKILYIIPPANMGYGYINGYFWQKGALHLSTYLTRESNNAYKVYICDGNIRTLDECFNILEDADCYAVGIYCLDHTKENGKKLIQRVIDLNIPKLFLGGPGIINSKEAYVVDVDNSNTDVFYCTGQGEEQILSFLNDLLPSKFAEKWDMSIYDKNEQNLNFEAYQIDLSEYINRQINNSDFPYPAITYSTLSHIGCSYRLKCGGCTFCGIPHHFYHMVDGTIFWRDFNNFRNFCNKNLNISLQRVNSIKDWGDSINTDILKELLKKRPDDCRDVRYNCYLSCRDITKENLDLLKALNCYSVYIGIDGTNTLSLKNLKKGYDLKNLQLKLDLLNCYPFKIEVGLILGNKDETLETLQETVSFAKKIKKIFREKIIVIQGNVLIPMPGSQMYCDLKKQVQKISGDNSFDPLMNLSIEQRIRLWLKHNSEITYEDCINIQHLIEEISPRKHSYVE